MIWDSVEQFLSMGGYGLYVWGSMAATVALLGGELFGVHSRRKAAVRRLVRINRYRQSHANESTP